MPQTTKEIIADIEKKFGFVPPFFLVTQDSRVLENLWQQTQSAYLNNPINPVFLESLFAYLSRFCQVPYCLVCHSCFLRPQGLKASEVLKMLEQPPPDHAEIQELVTSTNAMPTGLEEWPTRKDIQQVLMRLSVAAYLKTSTGALLMVRRLLAPEWYDHLVAFLGYVRTCGMWIDAHPELSYEADQRFKDYYDASVREEPGLIAFFASYRQRVAEELRRLG